VTGMGIPLHILGQYESKVSLVNSVSTTVSVGLVLGLILVGLVPSNDLIL